MSKIFVMGSMNMDLIAQTDVFPEEGETVMGTGFFTNPGGKGANQAVACAKQGGNVVMLGAVGNDAYGTELTEGLRDYHVDTSRIIKKDTNSGVAIIILENSKNRIIVNAGSNGVYDFEDYQDILSNEGIEGDYFLTQIETKVENVEKGLIYAKKLGMTTIFNPAPAVKISREALASTDYLILNETETKILTGVYPDTDENTNHAIDLLQQDVGRVIITLGSKGCVYKEKELQYIPKINVDAVDTTAAGDAFIGAFIAALSDGHTLREAIADATLCAALTVSSYGAQMSIPTKEEALAFKERLIRENNECYHQVFK